MCCKVSVARQPARPILLLLLVRPVLPADPGLRKVLQEEVRGGRRLDGQVWREGHLLGRQAQLP